MDPSVLANWGTGVTGTGPNPTDFSTSGDIFNLQNGTSATIGADWVLGTGVTLNVGDGTDAINFTIPSGFSLTNTGTSVTNVLASATVTIQNTTTYPIFGTLNAASTVNFNASSAAQTVQAVTYGNLILSNGAASSLAGNVTVAGILSFSGSSTLTIGAHTLTLNGTVSGMDASDFITGSATSNLTIGTAGPVGTLFFNTVGAGNDIATFKLSSAGGGVVLGSNLTVTTSLNYAAATGSVAIGNNTLTVNGTVTGMNGTNYLTGGASSNLTIGTAGSVGTLYFDQTTPGTTNNIATFNNSTTGTTTLGNAMDVGITLALTSGSLADGTHVITNAGNITGTGTESGTGGITLTGTTPTISGAQIQNLKLNNATVFSLTGSPTITGVLTFTSGKLSIGNNTLNLNGTVASMSVTNCITGGATSNLTIGSAGSVGTLFFDETTPGTTNNIATFTNNGAGTSTLGDPLSVGTALVLTAGGTIADGGNVITNAGNITGTGTESGAGGITMTGTTPTISGAHIQNLNLDNVTVFSLTGSTTITGVLTFTSGTLSIGSNTLNLNGTVAGMGVTNYLTGGAASNITIGSVGTVGTLFFDETTSGISNNIATFTNNGAGTTTLGDALHVGTALVLTAGGTIADGGNTITNAGNITGGGIETGPGGIVMTGAAKTISGVTIDNLTLDNAAGFNLSGSPTINSSLTLTAGSLTIGADNITLGSAISSVGGTPSAANMIIASGAGQVIKQVTSSGSFTYPVGDGAGPNFTPATLTFMSGTGTAGVNVKNVKDPHNANTVGDNYINRYWTVNTTSISYSITATYVPGDVVGTEALIDMGQYSVSLPWVLFGATNTGTHTLSAAGISANTSDFSGINSVGPSVSISPLSASICAGASVGLTATGAGDAAFTYSWTPTTGLSNANIANPSAHPAITTTYTVTATDGNGFPATSTILITVNTVPTITSISATPANVCVGTSVNLNATGVTGTGVLQSYNWTGPNAFTNTSTSPVFTPTVVANTGIYSLTVTYPGIGCTSLPSVTSVTVSATPTSTGVTNSGNLCAGGTLTLSSNSSNATSWTWNGSSGFSSAVQNPVFTPTISGFYTYTLSVSSAGTGCSPATIYTTAVTVNSAPVAVPTISGPLCIGGIETFTANATGGVGGYTYNWSGPGLVPANTATITATPVAVGTSTYSLTVTNGASGCNTGIVYIMPVTVNPDAIAAPAVDISTPAPICAGGAVNIDGNPSGSSSSYVWSGPSIATSTVAANITTFSLSATSTYTLTVTNGTAESGCSNTYPLTVIVGPAPTTVVTNSSPICLGGVATLSVTPSTNVYSWSGANLSTTTAAFPTATPTVTSTYFVVVNNGTTHPGCVLTYSTSVTVNATGPTAAPTNDGPLCNGGTVNLNAHGGGTTVNYSWSGPNMITSIFSSTVQATPNVTSTYTVTVTDGTGHSGCNSYYVTTASVSPTPIAAPTNASPICNTMTIELDANPGGSTTNYYWSGPNLTSSTIANPAFATPSVTSTYSLTVTNGTAESGCAPATVYTTVVTVNPLPGTIAGPSVVCSGSSVTLTDGGAGTWSSNSIFVAQVGTNGVVTGNAAGTTTITYTLGTGCLATTTITVNSLPSTITGNAAVCALSTTTLNATPPGGNWNSNVPGIASVVGGTGVVTGVSAGTTVISYILGTNCYSTTVVTVNPLPIVTMASSSPAICVNSSMSYSVTVVPAPSGLSYSYNWGYDIISDYAVTGGGCARCATATVNWTGSGPKTIVDTFTDGNGCAAYAFVNTLVNALPVFTPTVSATPICSGFPITLISGSAGPTYSWSGPSTLSSSIVSNPTTIPTTGVYSVTNVYDLTVTDGNGCTNTNSVSVIVNPQPNNISGYDSVCVYGPGNTTITLSDPTSGGTWSSSNPAIGSVDPALGIVTGVATVFPQAITITYLLAGGCVSHKTVTINPLPAAIAGTTFSVCQHSPINDTILLTDGTTGGFWTSSNPLMATVGSSTGGVTGLLSGSLTITYTLPTGCAVIKPIAVNDTPATIMGSSTVCVFNSVNSTTTLSDPTMSGNWLSNNPSVATINSSGVVTGITVGSTVITYTLPLTGCRVIKSIVVNDTPATISGYGAMCVFSAGNVADTLIDVTHPGFWSSSNPSLTSVTGSTTDTAVIAGLSAGTSLFTYSLPTGCITTKPIIVHPLPAPISTVDSVCTAPGPTSVITMTDDTTGGNWTSSNITLATIGATTGVVTGVLAGSLIITYTLPVTTCKVISPFIVKTTPSLHMTDTTICSGQNPQRLLYEHSNIPGTAFRWLVNVTPLGSLTGMTNDSGTVIEDILVNSSNTVPSYITYTVVPTYSGCVGVPDPFTVTVDPLPVIPIVSATLPDSNCYSNLFENFSSTYDSHNIYSWSATNATVYAQIDNLVSNCLVNFPNTGTSSAVTVTSYVNPYSQCKVSASSTVTLNTLTAVDTSSIYYLSGYLVCTDNTMVSYQWGYDDANLAPHLLTGQVNQSYDVGTQPVFNQQPYYWVLTTKNGCSQKSYYNPPPAGVTVPTEVNPVTGTENAGLKLYPNPAADYITLQFNGNTPANVEIIDEMGRKVRNSLIRNNNITIFVGDLPAGIYFVLLLQDDQKTGAVRFLKN